MNTQLLYLNILYLAFWSVAPYVNLQSENIGLSFNDISIILGVGPAAGAISGPMLGMNAIQDVVT